VLLQPVLLFESFITPFSITRVLERLVHLEVLNHVMLEPEAHRASLESAPDIFDSVVCFFVMFEVFSAEESFVTSVTCARKRPLSSVASHMFL